MTSSGVPSISAAALWQADRKASSAAGRRALMISSSSRGSPSWSWKEEREILSAEKPREDDKDSRVQPCRWLNSPCLPPFRRHGLSSGSFCLST
jgi:hypothetical protein